MFNECLGHPLQVFSPSSDVRPSQIFVMFKQKEKSNDVVKPFFS